MHALSILVANLSHVVLVLGGQTLISSRGVITFSISAVHAGRLYCMQAITPLRENRVWPCEHQTRGVRHGLESRTPSLENQLESQISWNLK